MAMWKSVKIGDILTESKIIEPKPSDSKKIRVRLNLNGVEQRPEKESTKGATKYYRRKTGQFIYGKQNFHKGAFGVIPPELDGFSSSADLPAFDVTGDVNTEWFVYWLQRDSFYQGLNKLARGAGSQRVAVKDFFNVSIEIPPINVQKKIVRNIDKYSHVYSKLISENQTQEKLLKDLRQAILQEAIEGKLTADWRAQNPVVKGDPNYDAEALLEQIKAEKEKLIAEGKLKKQKPLPPISEEEKPFELPEGWVWTRLDDIGLFERGKSKHRPRNDEILFKNGKYPFVQTGDVAQSKKSNYRISTYSKKYNEVGLKQSRFWHRGTLCITIAANIAETGFLDIDACFPDSVVGFTPLTEGNLPEYLRYFIEITRDEIEMFAPATAQKNINLGIINNLLFPLPPVVEQYHLINKLRDSLYIVSELSIQCQARNEQVNKLLQSVLKEAFSG